MPCFLPRHLAVKLMKTEIRSGRTHGESRLSSDLRPLSFRIAPGRRILECWLGSGQAGIMNAR